jgi:hypothetical protein
MRPIEAPSLAGGTLTHDDAADPRPAHLPWLRLQTSNSVARREVRS